MAVNSSFCDVSIDHVTALWPHVRAHIAKALDREGSGRFLPIDVLNLLLEGKARLWVAWNSETKTADAAVVTQFIKYPRKTELHIWIIGGGNMRAWIKPGREMIEAFARAQGCDFVTGAFRRGWIRMGGEGWKETGVTFGKRLRSGDTA